MKEIQEVVIDIKRGASIGRTSFMKYVTDAERFGGKVITGMGYPVEPCDCGQQLYSVDIDYEKTPEFHSFEICPICQRCYPLIYTFGLEMNGKPYQPLPDQVYESYVKDMKDAGVESFTLPRSWFEAHQHAIDYEIDEQDDPGAPDLSGMSVDAFMKVMDDEHEKQERIINRAKLIEKLSKKETFQLALIVELITDAQPGTLARFEKICTNFAAGKDIYDGLTLRV